MYHAAAATPNEETKRTHDTPQASGSVRINSPPSLFNLSQVASDSTAYRSGEKRHNGGRQREDFHRAEGSAETDLQRRRRLLAGLRPPRATIGRGDHDLRTPPSAVGAATSARRPWPLVL